MEREIRRSEEMKTPTLWILLLVRERLEFVAGEVGFCELTGEDSSQSCSFDTVNGPAAVWVPDVALVVNAACEVLGGVAKEEEACGGRAGASREENGSLTMLAE